MSFYPTKQSTIQGYLYYIKTFLTLNLESCIIVSEREDTMKRKKFIKGDKKQSRPKCSTNGCNHEAEPGETQCVSCLMIKKISNIPIDNKFNNTQMMYDHFNYNEFVKNRNLR